LGHFRLIFGFIFDSFSWVWQKNDQNEPKNETKKDVKNGYREHSSTENRLFQTWDRAGIHFLPSLCMMGAIECEAMGPMLS